MNKVEIFENVHQEFKKRGFVTDPRGEAYGRCLYNPETNVSIHVGNIGKSSAGISVFDMSNNGMNWGEAYKKLKNGVMVRFNFNTKTFDKFYNTTYQNRVKKLNVVLVD